MLKRTCYSDKLKEGEEVVISGWVHERRDLGGIKFILLRDREGIAQITAPKKKVSEEIFKLIDSLGREWVISVKGTVKSSPQAPNGLEVIPQEIEIISTAEPSLPLDPSEKVDADIDTRLDNRFMDIRKPKVTAIFKIRSEILRAAREYLLSQAFVEIQTPKITASGTEGGTELFPISYFEREAFLAQSPQLYKQTMMATGMDRVFEMAHYFRAEESNTRRHLSESDAIDIEMSFIENEEDVIYILENLVSHILNCVNKNKKNELSLLGIEVNIPSTPFRRVNYDQAITLLQEGGFNVRYGEDLGTETEKALGNIVKEKYGDNLYFIWFRSFQAQTQGAVQDEAAGALGTQVQVLSITNDNTAYYIVLRNAMTKDVNVTGASIGGITGTATFSPTGTSAGIAAGTSKTFVVTPPATPITNLPTRGTTRTFTITYTIASTPPSTGALVHTYTDA